MIPTTKSLPARVVVDGKSYRVVDSVIPADSRFDAMRAAFARRGIVAHVNALAPRKSVGHCQLFLMADGTAQRAIYATTGAVAREVAKESGRAS